MLRTSPRVPLLLVVLSFCVTAICEEQRTLKAGASCIDITPTKLPVIVNGNFFPATADKVLDPLHARCLILHDGKEHVVLVVVDSCLIPLALVDNTKRRITERTGIPADRIMISATHCHSAPSLHAALGTPDDGNYVNEFPDKIVESVVVAKNNLVPAKVGWAVGDDRNNVYCRRFLMKKGMATTNPFSGKSNDRAQMNPGHANPNKIARTGPVDTAVSVLSVLTIDDKPLALFANYSTHYAGVGRNVLSGDYFAVFADEIRNKISEHSGNDKMTDGFVGIMSNGTSGDANCIDFLNSQRKFDHRSVGKETADAAFAVWPNIEYFDTVPLGMIEKRITINNRVPTPDEVRAAKDHIARLPDGKAKTVPDVYAFGTVRMADWPKTSEIPIQAIRIGELGITALPAEVYGITGLEIKARSPFRPTFNIGLANGYFGYVPPPEQHALGGYNTWRTPTSCLETDAEPKIKETALELLNHLAQQP